MRRRGEKRKLMKTYSWTKQKKRIHVGWREEKVRENAISLNTHNYKSL